LTSIHAKGIIHTNLKPSKILINASKLNAIYITDFSKCYIFNENLRSETTIIFQQKEKGRSVFQRNPNIFSGNNISNGTPPVIGDDYESLAYILLYLLKGGKWFLNDIENYDQKNYGYKMRALSLFKLTTPIEKQCDSLPRFLFINSVFHFVLFFKWMVC